MPLYIVRLSSIMSHLPSEQSANSDLPAPLGPVLLGEGSEEEENPVTQSAEAGQSDSMMGGL